MRAINHALTGAIIGLVVNEPMVAVPAALASHYVLDAIPHHDQGAVRGKLNWQRSEAFWLLIVADALLCGLLVLSLALEHPLSWQLAALCAFVSAAPDLFWVNHYIKIKQGQKWQAGWHSKFAGRIQWFERPIGAVVEVAWFAGALAVLMPLLG